ncbi:SDR family oxidoreductase [Fervidobacterium islandicum]|uniref:SDR family oxidoreductase n=1 Tax=Fervidobacterium islandicum TaxID=2423 RepID=A0AAI8CLH9_FERIS|nr:SDR family oxidoreductase [Fervidobacterium islandicum]AMW32436.1 SDR family oxidoreductase [Fervidobacterium islandicum]
MAKKYDLRIYRWALVTGASSGIGKEFAYQLAKKGLNLILIGRSMPALTSVADEIHKISSSSVVILQADLTKDLDMVFDNTSRFNIDLLVNNAGFGLYGDFFSNSLDDYIRMINLNISALTKLTHYYGAEMAKRKSGGIINIASVAGFFPIPHLAVYSATKAYVYSLSMSLWAELQDKNVNVLCVAPGPTETRFFERARMETKGKLMKPEHVVAGALKAFENGNPLYVPGFGNKLTYYFVRKFFGDKFIANFLAKYF